MPCRRQALLQKSCQYVELHDFVHRVLPENAFQVQQSVEQVPGSSGMTLTVCSCSGGCVLVGTACSVLITFAVAVPEGNLSFSLRMVWVRKGTAQKTPRNAKARDHSTSCPYDSMTGPSGGFWSTVMIPIAGITPTNPARFQRDDMVYGLCQGIRCTYNTLKEPFALHFILEIRAHSSVAQGWGKCTARLQCIARLQCDVWYVFKDLH